MKRMPLILGATMLAVLAAGDAHAVLLGVTQTPPSVSLTASPTLIYDSNGGAGGVGRLVVVTGAAQLAEGAAAGGSTVTQSYFSGSDSTPDLVLYIDVDTATGAFLDGTVSIGFGNLTSAARYSWQGTVTNFGFAAGSGTIFDATWTVTSDQYQNMPQNMAQFVNGLLTGGSGALQMTSSAAWGGPSANFGNDWVYGNNVTNEGTYAALAPYTGGLTNPYRQNSTITASVWAAPAAVPLPGAVWMLLSGLGALVPMTRRNRT